jgi:hypothetical protein
MKIQTHKNPRVTADVTTENNITLFYKARRIYGIQYAFVYSL